MVIWRRNPGVHTAEQGYVLPATLFLVALLMLSLSIALPVVTQNIQRDREIETIHRGQQYIRAIQLYYRRFHAYPPSVGALLGSNDIRFLRKRYADPLTGKNDWKPIQFGRNNSPTAMGFFGVPLGIAGASPPPSGTAANDNQDSPTETSSESSSDDDQSVMPGAESSSGDNSTDAPDGNAGASSPSNSNSSGQVYAGGIVGFTPAGVKKSILIYKTKSYYNQWEFVYDPLTDTTMRGLIPLPVPSGPPTNSGSPGFNPGAAGGGPPGGGIIDPQGIP